MNGFVPLTGKNVTPSPWHGDFKKTPAGEPADAEGAFISFYSPISPSPVCAAFHPPLYPPTFPAERLPVSPGGAKQAEALNVYIWKPLSRMAPMRHFHRQRPMHRSREAFPRLR